MLLKLYPCSSCPLCAVERDRERDLSAHRDNRSRSPSPQPSIVIPTTGSYDYSVYIPPPPPLPKIPSLYGGDDVDRRGFKSDSHSSEHHTGNTESTRSTSLENIMSSPQTPVVEFIFFLAHRTHRAQATREMNLKEGDVVRTEEVPESDWVYVTKRRMGVGGMSQAFFIF